MHGLDQSDRLEDVSFEVRSGEIVGIAGISGNGQQALMAALAGEMLVESDAVRLFNLPVGRLNSAQRRALGLRYVPEQRLGHAAVSGMTLADNALLTDAALQSRAVLNLARARIAAAEIVQRFHVRAATIDQSIETLSGGNLQKFIIGREVLPEPRVLLLDQPTSGVDAGSAASIRNELIALRAAGCAIVIVSEDIDELYELADRLIVMAGGRVSPSRAPRQISTTELGRWMAGTWNADEHHSESGGERRVTSWKLVPREAASRRWTWLSPLVAIALTLLAGCALFAALGTSPWQGLSVFIVAPLASMRGWSELALKATPLMLCGVGLAVCFRANVWNIGAEGQLIAGAIVGGGIALLATAESPRIWFVWVLLGSLVGGALWASITAWLRDRFNANEILVSLMLVYVAQQLISWVVQGPWRDPNGYGFPQTELFAAAARVPTLFNGSRLNAGGMLAVLASVVIWWLLARSVIGYQLKVVGLAPRAALYAGFSSRRSLWIALLTSGALAGLAGGLEVAGPIGQLTGTISPGYGFAAIIVAFVGRLHPVGVIFASLVMALFYIGGELAQSRLGLPSALTGVYQGLLLFFLLACDTLVNYRVQLVRSATA